MSGVYHGTIEGFRLHRHYEEQACPSCQGAMDQLLGQVRDYQARVRGTIAAPKPKPPFTRVMLAKRRELAAAERPAPVDLPPVVIPATPCVGLESWMPSAPRSNLKKFRAAGWEARLTRAAGPRIAANGMVPEGKEVVYTVCLAAQRIHPSGHRERIIMTWQYDGTSWKLDDILHSSMGVIKSNQIKEILNG